MKINQLLNLALHAESILDINKSITESSEDLTFFGGYATMICEPILGSEDSLILKKSPAIKMKILVEKSSGVKINSLDDLRKTDQTLIKRSGSGNDKGKSKEIDPLIVDLIATSDGRTTDIAKEFGVSNETVSNYRQGNKGGAKNEGLTETVLAKKLKIEDIAVTKLMDTLKLFNPEGLEDQMQVITAADKMSRIVDQLAPQKDKNNVAQVQLILHAPRMNKSNEYEIIEAD